MAKLLRRRTIEAEVADEISDREYEYSESYEREKVIDALKEADVASRLLAMAWKR